MVKHFELFVVVLDTGPTSVAWCHWYVVRAETKHTCIECKVENM